MTITPFGTVICSHSRGFVFRFRITYFILRKKKLTFIDDEAIFCVGVNFLCTVINGTIVLRIMGHAWKF
ncbi:hypothetical protein BX666DRAFT_2001024, partial [Dichotomocladium elegans]